MKILIVGAVLLRTLNAQAPLIVPGPDAPDESILLATVVPTGTADVILPTEGIVIPVFASAPVGSAAPQSAAAAPESTDFPSDPDCPSSCYAPDSKLRRREGVPSSNGGFAAFQWPGAMRATEQKDACADDVPDWLSKLVGKKRAACQQACPAKCYASQPNNALDDESTTDGDYGDESTTGATYDDESTTDYGSGDESTTDYGSGDESTTDYGSGDESTTDYGSSDESSTDYGSGDDFTTVYDDGSTTDYGSGDESTTDYGYGDESTTDYGYGDESTTDYGYGDESTTDYGYGDESTTDYGYGDESTTDYGYGDDTTTDYGYGDESTTDYGYGDGPTTDYGYGDDTTTDYGYGDDTSTDYGYGDATSTDGAGYGGGSNTVSTPTTLVTSTKTAVPSTPGYTGSTIAGICPQQCNPFDPAQNKCDITTSCTTTGNNKYYCACRAGFSLSKWNPKDFTKQFKFAAQPYVYVAPGEVCDKVCDDQTCSEVISRPACQ